MRMFYQMIPNEC